jgi:hypothetical protein
LSERLTQDERLLPTLFAAADYRRQITKQLEAQLGLSAEELALALYVVVLTIDGLPDQRLPSFDDAFWNEIASLRASHRMIMLDEKQRQAIRDLFDDFFKLRDNVYDGPRISGLLRGCTLASLLDILTQIDITTLDKDYRLGSIPLKDILEMMQEELEQRAIQKHKSTNLSPSAEAVLVALTTDKMHGVPLGQVSAEVWNELQSTRPDMYARLWVTAMRCKFVHCAALPEYGSSPE